MEPVVVTHTHTQIKWTPSSQSQGEYAGFSPPPSPSLIPHCCLHQIAAPEREREWVGGRCNESRTVSGCTRGPGHATSGEAVRREELFSKNGVATETPSPCWWSRRATGDDGEGEHKDEDTHTKKKKTPHKKTHDIIHINGAFHKKRCFAIQASSKRTLNGFWWRDVSSLANRVAALVGKKKINAKVKQIE